MTQHYEAHANKIVQDFVALLEPEVREQLAAEHLDELSMMIESAIGTEVLSQLERVADQIDQLAAQVRRGAEHWQEDEGAAG